MNIETKMSYFFPYRYSEISTEKYSFFDKLNCYIKKPSCQIYLLSEEFPN